MIRNWSLGLLADGIRTAMIKLKMENIGAPDYRFERNLAVRSAYI
jgi:hypothetical protein